MNLQVFVIENIFRYSKLSTIILLSKNTSLMWKTSVDDARYFSPDIQNEFTFQMGSAMRQLIEKQL